MKNNWLPLVILCVLFIILHTFGLTLVPVFADEAIYIRWAQLIISDAQQYTFFALNDGKTPLFIWSLVPFINYLNDPLWAGRLLSVIVGLLQMLAIYKLGFKMVKNEVGYIAALLVMILPFWVINHRFALMDPLLTLMTTAVLIATYNLTSISYKNTLSITNATKLVVDKKNIVTIFCIGLFFFLALLTKLSALLLLPAITIIILLGKNSRNILIQKIFLLFTGFFVALILFSFLALHPTFPQLFSRGSDFLLNATDIKDNGWSVYVTGNVRLIITTFIQYLSLPLFLMLVITPFLQKNKNSIVLFLAGILYLIPIILLAKVLHSRYLLPSLPFFTLSLAISIQYWLEHIKKLKLPVSIKQLVPAMFILGIVLLPLTFTLRFVTDPESVRLTADDQAQYFVDWSAGHGIKEVTEMLLAESSSTSIALATEGSFGTLPDGVLMYIFNKNVDTIYVEGIEQPIYDIKGKYRDRALDYEKQWLVVNNYRLRMELPKDALITEYCHPQKIEYCLQLWDISSKIED